MANSYVQYQASGTNYVVPFQYISKSHVLALVNGSPVTFTWVTNTVIALSSVPPNGSVVELRRSTPVDKNLVDFVDGSTLTEHDLDLSALQALFLSQESADIAEGALRLNASGAFDVRGRRAMNAADPVSDSDLVNKRWVESTSNTLLVKANDAVSRVLGAANNYLTVLNFGAGGSDAAANHAAFINAGNPYKRIVVPEGKYKFNFGAIVAAGRVLEMQPGAFLESNYGNGALDISPNSGLISFTEGASKDVWYWGRRMPSVVAAGVGAANLGFGGNGFMFDIRGEAVDLGLGPYFFNGFSVRHIMEGGPNVRGGRQGFFSTLYRQGATAPNNDNRNYVAGSFFNTVTSGDGGYPNPNPADKSPANNYGRPFYKGADFGINPAVFIDDTAVYTLEASPMEVNSFVMPFNPSTAGPSTRILANATFIPCHGTRGIEIDTVLLIGAQYQTGKYGPHAGCNYGLLFSDVNGTNALHENSTMIGAKWVNRDGQPDPTILHILDASTFNVTGSIVKGKNIDLRDGEIRVSGKRVLGAQQPSIAYVDTGSSQAAALNSIIGTLKAHGLCA